MGVLSAVRANSVAFKELFISTTKVTDAVKRLIRLKPGMSGSSNFATVVLAHIHKFVKESNEEGKHSVYFWYCESTGLVLVNASLYSPYSDWHFITSDACSVPFSLQVYVEENFRFKVHFFYCYFSDQLRQSHKDNFGLN